jgi:predicted metalloprotease with PDZ domain
MSAAEVAKIGFKDERIRHTPYERGFLYFADCDARIREASKGKRKLDDVILELFARRNAGEKITQADWLDALA